MVRIDEAAPQIKVDAKDKRIIDLLSTDSRISFQQIAKKLQISRDIAAYRIKKLVDLGIISRFTLKFKYSDFSYIKFFVLLQLREMPKEKSEELESFFFKNKEITEVVSYFDKWDYQLIVQCKDLKVLDSILNSFNKSFSNFVIDQEVFYITTDYFAPESLVKFDAKDVELLNTLLHDSRLSAVELGLRTNLSSDAILYRLKKYADMKFTVSLNNNKLGLHTYDVVFSLRYLDAFQEAKLQTMISDFPEIQEAYRLLGNWNICLRIAVKEPMDLHKITRKIRNSFADNIKDFDIMHTYKEIKNMPYL